MVSVLGGYGAPMQFRGPLGGMTAMDISNMTGAAAKGAAFTTKAGLAGPAGGGTAGMSPLQQMLAQERSRQAAANAANEKRYAELLKLNKDLQGRVAANLEGLGDAARADIGQVHDQRLAQTQQGLVSAGLANTSARGQAARAAARGEARDVAALEEMLRRERIGYDVDLTRDRMGIIERRQDIAPDNSGRIMQMAQQLGGAPGWSNKIGGKRRGSGGGRGGRGGGSKDPYWKRPYGTGKKPPLLGSEDDARKWVAQNMGGHTYQQQQRAMQAIVAGKDPYAAAKVRPSAPGKKDTGPKKPVSGAATKPLGPSSGGVYEGGDLGGDVTFSSGTFTVNEPLSIGGQQDIYTPVETDAYFDQDIYTPVETDAYFDQAAGGKLWAAFQGLMGGGGQAISPYASPM